MKHHLHHRHPPDSDGAVAYRIMYDAEHYTIFDGDDVLVASVAFDVRAGAAAGEEAVLDLAIAHARRLDRAPADPPLSPGA